MEILDVQAFKSLQADQPEIFDFTFGFFTARKIRHFGHVCYSLTSYVSRSVWDDDLNWATHQQFYIGLVEPVVINYLRTLTSDLYFSELSRSLKK